MKLWKPSTIRSSQNSPLISDHQSVPFFLAAGVGGGGAALTG